MGRRKPLNWKPEELTQHQIQMRREELQVQISPKDDASIEELLRQLRLTHTNGGAEFARFHISNFDTILPLFTPSGIDESNFFARFLTLPNVRTALPQFQLEKKLRLRLTLQYCSPYTLDGELTGTLMMGGAYEKFRGPLQEARQITQAFADAVMENRYGTIAIYRSSDPWSPWFHDIAWDLTWFGVDLIGTEAYVWLLCVTDTD